jgi:hypothetical protein
MIRYHGSFYVVAEPPSGMTQSTPSTPEDILNTKEDNNGKKPPKIEPEKKPKPIPYDPRIDKVKSKLEKKKDLLQKLTLPYKSLKELIDRYDLPAAQILIRDFSSSKFRILQKFEEIISSLEKLSSEGTD